MGILNFNFKVHGVLWKLIAVTATNYTFRTECGWLINFFSHQCAQRYEATKPSFNMVMTFSLPSVIFFLIFVKV
jgi:hypothetical protein